MVFPPPYQPSSGGQGGSDQWGGRHILGKPQSDPPPPQRRAGGRIGRAERRVGRWGRDRRGSVTLCQWWRGMLIAGEVSRCVTKKARNRAATGWRQWARVVDYALRLRGELEAVEERTHLRSPIRSKATRPARCTLADGHSSRIVRIIASANRTSAGVTAWTP